MAARLGEVLYWACNAAVAAIAAGGAAELMATPDGWMGTILMVVPGALTILFGRAALYVLAGR